MSVLEIVEEHLAQGDLGAVEDEWLGLLDTPDTSIEDFIGTARAIAKRDRQTADALLEMLDEHLIQAERWRDRLRLMEAFRSQYLPEGRRHPEIMKTLDRLWSERPSFEALVEMVGLRKAIEDIPKTWKKVDRLITLLSLDVGSVVLMEGKGAGRVVETNMALESFNIALDTIGEVRVGFNAAAKMLTPLKPGHILHRKVVDPDAVRAIAEANPSELLRAVLESYSEPRTGADVRRDLAGIVTDKRWSSWWTAARKHPQVISGGKGRQTYRWAASSADAEDAVWAAFEAAPIRDRLERLRRDGARDATLRARMSKTLTKNAAAALASGDQGLACETWLNLDKHGELDGSLDWSATSLATDCEDPRKLAAGILDRTWRERFYFLVREHRESWHEAFIGFFAQESEPRLLDRLSEGISEVDGAMESQIEWLLSQPRKAPAAFTWLAERAAERDEWRQRNPLRLLVQILAALRDERTFGTFRVRLVAQVESGGTIPRALAEISEEQATQAAQAIEKASSLEAYQRKPLVAALELKFPFLRQEIEAPLYATPDAIAAKRAELKTLLEDEIPANRKAIEEARELGDLRENFEYKSARQRHEYLAARASSLDGDLTRARPIDPSVVNGEEVTIGSRVRLERTDGPDRVITILGPWDSQPEKDVLANESDLAQSLLGQSLGTSIVIGDASYSITAIEPYTS